MPVQIAGIPRISRSTAEHGDGRGRLCRRGPSHWVLRGREHGARAPGEGRDLGLGEGRVVDPHVVDRTAHVLGCAGGGADAQLLAGLHEHRRAAEGRGRRPGAVQVELGGVGDVVDRVGDVMPDAQGETAALGRDDIRGGVQPGGAVADVAVDADGVDLQIERILAVEAGAEDAAVAGSYRRP